MSTQQAIEDIDYGIGKKTLQSYVVGFFLALILTLIAFAIVMNKIFTGQTVYVVLAALAILQLLVQSYCFLRLNARSESQWSTMPFLFTIFIIAVLVSGSIWIMYNLNYNMFH